MPGRSTLPSTLKRSPPKAQRTWAKAHDSAVQAYGEGERAHRTGDVLHQPRGVLGRGDLHLDAFVELLRERLDLVLRLSRLAGALLFLFGDAGEVVEDTRELGRGADRR